MNIIEGRCWKFGDDISTDLIAPGRLFHLRSNLPELAKHLLEDAKPGFYEKISEGDIIVAGINFGQGSSREHAPTIIKMAGISAVVAKSFARIFYRNCINVGLPAVMVDTDKINEGDILRIDIAKGILEDVSSGEKFSFSPLPETMMKILAEGGLVAYIKKNGDLIL
ncbi:MAG: 3-isopropylmalate dehydratase small subunit [Candidatus Schekmanbacteria bacterium]|nr:MAG: 3-isopropylmalate dehydratase small subunit [Candidatus Schekmanbacteria bacterium]